MRRYKDYQPHQSVFITVSGDDRFREGTFERFIVDVFSGMDIEVDSHESVERDRGGEAPYDPRGIFGVIFYGFARGIFSSRKLEAACASDLGFMYVSGFTTPDHSTFSRYISEHGDLMRKIFARILYLADGQGYVDYRLIATDGTKIKANASSQFTATIGGFNKKRARLEEKIRQALERSESCVEPEEQESIKRKVDRYRANKQRVDEFLRKAERIETKRGKEVKQNITDPDCRLMKIQGAFGVGYNAQASCSGDSGIIIAATVGNNADDRENLFKMEQRIRVSVPEHSRGLLSQSKYLFDNGYYSSANVLTAVRGGLDIYTPERKDADYYGGGRRRAKKSVGVADCEIDQDEQGLFIRCPGGRVLRKCTTQFNNGRQWVRFPVFSPQGCEGCSHYSICIGKRRAKRRDFTIAKSKLESRKTLDAHNRKMRSEAGRLTYSKRMSLIERAFGHLKENTGFKRFLRRGLEKVNNEWLILCGSYNLTRMFNLANP
jgi:transposase